MVATLSRDVLRRPVLDVAPDLLGCVLTAGGVSVRLTEVEAYDGSNDPGSHAYRGRTQRNAVMFGPAGHLYVYLSYGIHWCANVVCGSDGVASAVLLRAGEVVEGEEEARARWNRHVSFRDLARGPARLCRSLGIDHTMRDVDLLRAGSPVLLQPGDAPHAVERGPRVGLRAAADHPWRFWVAEDRTVSQYRPHQPKRRARQG